MQHPFERLSARAFGRVYWGFLAATVLLAVPLAQIGAAYAAKRGPNGETYNVIAFELMGTPAKAQSILAAWGEEGIAAAKLHTKLDYLFLVCYSSHLAAGIIALYSGAGPRWRRWGRLLAGAQWIGALLDAVENTALLKVLSGSPVTPYPQLATACASGKFLILALGLAYLLAALPQAFRGPERRLSAAG